MFRLIVVLGILLATGAPSWAAQRLPVPQVVDDGAPLSWVVKPDLMQIGRLVSDHGVHKGYAIVDCALTAGGRPKSCVVVEEEGGGFGKFVIELAGRYQAASKDKAGQPVAGRKVRLAYAVGGTATL